MVYRAEVIAILTRNNSKLVVGMARIRIYLGSEVIVALGRAPVMLFVLVNKFSFAVA